MNEEYRRGKEMGGVETDIKNLIKITTDHNAKQDEWNLAMNERVKMLEAWVASTTGKIVVITTVASFIGWAIYQVVGWIITYKFK